MVGNKRGKRWLRYALVESAIHVERKPGSLEDFCKIIKSRKGVQVARVAVARKLAKIIYWMWRENRRYGEVLARIRKDMR